MRHTHICRLCVVGWLLCTVPGTGHAQSVRTGDLPPEVKALLQELRGERKGSTGRPQLAPPPGTTVEDASGSATPDGYEHTLLRYLRLRELATQTAADHATALERQLHTIETQLAGAASRSLQPQAVDETGNVTAPEHVDERSPGGRDPRVAETGDALSSERTAADRAGQQLLQDYKHITQRLEELAASSRAMTQRLRDLLQ